jgi:hypothetical protein
LSSAFLTLQFAFSSNNASWFLTFVTVRAATAAAFSGFMRLYRDINYNHKLTVFAFTQSNQCYNIANCDDYNNAVSSVEWSGLLTTATYAGASQAKIAFTPSLAARATARASRRP